MYVYISFSPLVPWYSSETYLFRDAVHLPPVFEASRTRHFLMTERDRGPPYI